MRRTGLLLLLTVATLRAQTGPGGEPGSWLNAADLGASGSAFTTTATTTAGAKDITVADIGDLKVGQGVMISRCLVRYTNPKLWGPRAKYGASQPLGDKVEIRGYDGAAGSWIVYALDVLPGTPAQFRWSDDLGRTWHPPQPLTRDWVTLSGGTEVRFQEFGWSDGYTVTFSARDQLVTRIEAIHGTTVTLREAPNRSAGDAVLRHCDDAALQAAIDTAVKQRQHLYIAPGTYRLTRSLAVRNAAGMRLETSSPEHTTLDISEGEGSCFALYGGTDITLRNFKMVGHTGFADRDIAGYFNTLGARGIWGFYLKNSCAVSMAAPERVLIENCHGTRMSCECFVSGGPSRGLAAQPNERHTKSLTYLRCSAIDCGRNGFNDWNIGPENTNILNCRIVDVGGCAWESASRFVRFVGNYVRNAGTVAIGNLGVDNRDPTWAELGSGQHVVADNVFEGRVPYGICAIRTARGATQVIIRHNTFVNFGSPAIEASGLVTPNEFPSANTSIVGNMFDMTDRSAGPRVAIDVSAADTLIADNQIVVRGAVDPNVTALRLTEPALNVTVHDNLIRGCGTGIRTTRSGGRVGEVVSPTEFVPSLRTVAGERGRATPGSGDRLVWTAAAPWQVSTVTSFDPATFRYTLAAPRDSKVGEPFEVIPAAGPRWLLHHNTVESCSAPLVFDSYGGDSAIVRDNLFARGEASGVQQAVELRGRCDLLDNRFSGFDEPDSTVLALFPGKLGDLSPSLLRGNVFRRCRTPATAPVPELWTPADAAANVVLDAVP
ncbi:MAG: right-handed parallel beta-helix repeat-containing protein [Fimbriimonadaceae bacterium]|nr:right-handed parallel beta-helix repeat-containing protein [Fimbriimonadaceae bacterium]